MTVVDLLSSSSGASLSLIQTPHFQLRNGEGRSLIGGTRMRVGGVLADALLTARPLVGLMGHQGSHQPR